MLHCYNKLQDSTLSENKWMDRLQENREYAVRGRSGWLVLTLLCLPQRHLQEFRFVLLDSVILFRLGNEGTGKGSSNTQSSVELLNKEREYIIQIPFIFDRFKDASLSTR